MDSPKLFQASGDAAGFYALLMRKICEESSKFKLKFTGVELLMCFFADFNIENNAFMIANVDLLPRVNINGKTNLHESLVDYFKNVGPQNRKYITTCPEYLVISLMRYNSQMIKNAGYLEFPELLDMRDFVLKKERYSNEIVTNLSKTVNTLYSGLTVPSVPSENTDCLYKLHSIIVHSGSISGGHYYTYISCENNQWICVNDKYVSSVDYETVTKNSFGVKEEEIIESANRLLPTLKNAIPQKNATPQKNVTLQNAIDYFGLGTQEPCAYMLAYEKIHKKN
jgi:hypothetical protein